MFLGLWSDVLLRYFTLFELVVAGGRGRCRCRCLSSGVKVQESSAGCPCPRDLL